MAKVAMSVTQNIVGVAAAAGSSDWHYNQKELVCGDVSQAELDAAMAAFDHDAFADAVALQAVAEARRMEHPPEGDVLDALCEAVEVIRAANPELAAQMPKFADVQALRAEVKQRHPKP